MDIDLKYMAMNLMIVVPMSNQIAESINIVVGDLKRVQFASGGADWYLLKM